VAIAVWLAVCHRRCRFLGAISAAELHFALKVGEIDLAVAGVQVHAAFTRHLDVDIDACGYPMKTKCTRKAHVEFHRIAILMLFHENAFPNLVACAGPTSLVGLASIAF